MVPLGSSRVVTVDARNHVKVWNLQPDKIGSEENWKDVECVQEFMEHEDQVYCCIWWDGKLFTGDYTGAVRIWI